jgi:hypothetical protein
VAGADLPVCGLLKLDLRPAATPTLDASIPRQPGSARSSRAVYYFTVKVAGAGNVVFGVGIASYSVEGPLLKITLHELEGRFWTIGAALALVLAAVTFLTVLMV